MKPQRFGTRGMCSVQLKDDVVLQPQSRVHMTRAISEFHDIASRDGIVIVRNSEMSDSIRSRSDSLIEEPEFDVAARSWKDFLNYQRIRNVLTAKLKAQDGLVSILASLYACSVPEYIEVLGYTYQSAIVFYLYAYLVAYLQVRSATLDTWLPEQVAFIQSMGNEKANSYWEAELPPNYDRVGIENFIRAKYEDKRWVARNEKPKSPSSFREEKSPSHLQKPVERGRHAAGSENTFDERKKIQPSNAMPATRISVPAPPKGPEQVIPVVKPQHIEKVEPVAPPPQADTSKQTTDITQNSPPKVDFATDLFDMLSMDDPNEKCSEAADASADDNWAGFQLPNFVAIIISAAAEASTAEKTNPLTSVESTPQSTSGIEDLFKDSPSVTPSLTPEKPQKDVKNDIMSLFEKKDTVSPFSMQQQQLAMLAQQQSLLMAAAAKSAGGDSKYLASLQQQQSLLMAAAAKSAGADPNYLARLQQQQSLFMAAAAKSAGGDAKYPAGIQQPGSNTPVQCWPAAGYSIPGAMPMASQEELQKLMQTMNTTAAHSAGSSVHYPLSSYYGMGQIAPVNGTTTTGESKPQSASPVSSTPSKTGSDYDFSSLTQGMFAKH
ncbi:hypothetical protein Fmac_021146 [Flemingia macrophylla]|uniref:Arf-GAP domain-containing protein n=1 Tax=Flemingia macrophylla TaxID=520843 RepID=A0ABD1LW29_9FABA